MKFCHFTWAIIILSSSITEICLSCVLEERRALLNFKTSINGTAYPDRILPSWIDDDDHPATGSDCCSWEGVKCDSIGRIVQLQLGDLERRSRESYFYEYDRKCYSNLSILVPLENLQAVNLSYNYFDNSILVPCEGLASFKSLESLHLDGNKMGNRTLECLSTISSLKNLSLAQNEISTSGDCEGLESLKNLEFLNLDWNYIGNTSLQCVTTISSLKYFSMAGNYLQGLFPFKEISRIKQLQHLDMSQNYFSGPVSFTDCEGWANLKNLEFLSLDGNHMDNTFSLQCVSTISSLKYLSMAENSMRGLFPFKEINRLKQLQHLDMSYNMFSSPMSFTALKLENLELLNLGGISFRHNAVEFSSIDVMTSLKALYLDGNEIKNSSIIQEICSLKNLVELDLSGNSFDGNVPLCFNTLISLEFLDISYNNFSGTIPKSASLKFLDISHNNFSGTIPSLAIASLVHLESLSLESNHFEGSFSFGSFANHSKLQVFKLQDQDKEIYVNFDGLPLLPPFQLRVLYLVQCNLNNETRRIPDFLLSQKELRQLDLSSNNLVGEFPNWLLENNTHLLYLTLRNNSFKGPFLGDGTLVLQDLQKLDISSNEVSGQVPQDIGYFFPSLEIFNLSRNCFQGRIPQSLGGLKNIMRVDLSHNNFSGKFRIELELDSQT